jgi:dihydrofolate synthase/folylpolyglutamate synthase
MRYQGMDLGLFETALLGSYQLLNAATAILAAMVLGQDSHWEVNLPAIRDGIAQARWPGRLEIVSRSPFVLLDGAHNPQGAEELTRCLRQFFPAADPVLVTGVMHTKDSLGIARILAPCVRDVIVTEPMWTKALPAEEYAQDYTGRIRGEVEICKDQTEALERGLALATAHEAPLVVAGSLYLAGAARTWARGKGWIL